MASHAPTNPAPLAVRIVASIFFTRAFVRFPELFHPDDLRRMIDTTPGRELLAMRLAYAALMVYCYIGIGNLNRRAHRVAVGSECAALLVNLVLNLYLTVDFIRKGEVSHAMNYPFFMVLGASISWAVLGVLLHYEDEFVARKS